MPDPRQPTTYARFDVGVCLEALTPDELDRVADALRQIVEGWNWKDRITDRNALALLEATAEACENTAQAGREIGRLLRR